MTTTRRLQPWEMPDIISLASAFHAETGIGGTFNGDRMLSVLAVSTSCVVGMFKSDTLVGVMIGVVAPHFMTDEVMANEVMWYVMPDHRCDPKSLGMLRAFEEWAKECGATSITMVNLASNPGVKKLYSKMGYTETETHHIKFF